MSHHFDGPLSTQSDWQGQYSFLPPGENSLYPKPFDHGGRNRGGNESQAQPRSAPAPANFFDIITSHPDEPGHASPSMEHHTTLRHLNPGHSSPQTPTHKQLQRLGQPDGYVQRTAPPLREGEPYPPSEMARRTMPSHPPPPSNISPSRSANEESVPVKEEDEEDVVDEEEAAEGEGDGSAPTMTAAERTAARRKMKRFRLTHQQTRFLMSEFAKQPHPDAAHRERLSREIPGLSPRQVQVWFQNRRAKIKRLTADDRKRMIKMRAVPDDFDNVQALHSPYGAVHGLAGPIASPVDYGAPSYAEHVMRPLMVDVRRPGEGADAHLSPTGLSPTFGSIGFNTSTPLSSADVLSPLSATSSERYGYGSHISTPLSAGLRRANPFHRQGGYDASMQSTAPRSRSPVRPPQPLQLRETMSRCRSETIQSPLRSSMSWKDNSIDYNTYSASGTSPRPQSVYPPDALNSSGGVDTGGSGGGNNSSLGGYDSSTYSAPASTAALQSPTHPTHMSYHHTINNPHLPRPPTSSGGGGAALRAPPTSLPLGLSLHGPYKHGTPGPGPLQATSRTELTAQVADVTSGYSASFPSAPLTAPSDFSVPRTPGFRTTQEYAVPQMSAPIAPPNDFAQAYQASVGRGGRGEGHMGEREDYGSGSHDHSMIVGMDRPSSMLGGVSPASSRMHSHTT